MNGQTKRIIAENIFGVVVWFDGKKGYGFIRREDTVMDLFVHYSNIKTNDYFRDLQKGQRVLCNVLEDHKGFNAVDVTPLGQVVHVFASNV